MIGQLTAIGGNLRLNTTGQLRKNGKWVWV